MIRILFFLFVFLNIQVIQAQDSSKKKTKEKKVKLNRLKEGFTFPLGKPEDSLFVTFSKGTDETQLNLEGQTEVWLGREYPMIHFSTVVITFSKPVTSIDFYLSHFNFDNVGKEVIEDFILVDGESNNITSSATFSWKSGPETGLETSTPGGTIFNEQKRMIRAADGNYGEAASGQLFISSPKPFTQITFTQSVIYGTPNGIIISQPNYTLATNSVETSNTFKDSPIQKDATQIVKDPVADTIPQRDSIPQRIENKEMNVKTSKDNLNLEKGSIANLNDTTRKSETAVKPKELTKKEHEFQKKMKSVEKSGGYTFNLCDQDNTKVTFFKGKAVGSHLSIIGDTSVWLGEMNIYGDYSDILIAFSKPVNSIDLVLRNFNNTTYGSEQIQDFKIMDEEHSNVSSTAKLSWASGSLGITKFDEKDKVISALKGKSGPEASGILSISNSKAFSYITFTHKVNTGTPGGILVNARYNCPPPKENAYPKNYQPLLKSTSSVPEKPIVDSISKEKESPLIKADSILPTVSEQPKEVVAKVEVKKEPVAAPVKNKPIVKPAPKKETKVTPKVTVKNVPPKPKTVAKKTVEKKPVVKSTPKKTIPPKKVTVTSKPAKVNTSVKKEIKKSYVKKAPVPVKKKEIVKKVIPSRKQPHTLAQIDKLKVGEKIKLDNVFFKQSLPELLPDSYVQLDTLVIILNNHPKLEIELQGYTDNVGDPQKNLILSEQRVMTVKNYLISKGVAKERMSQKGFGGNDPIVANTTEENKKLNRRVEFMITKK